jgi:hypothetical protein
LKNFLDLLLYLICGIPVVFAVDDDPELWDNPRKKARIRRKWRHAEKSAERRKSGKKTDV